MPRYGPTLSSHRVGQNSAVMMYSSQNVITAFFLFRCQARVSLGEPITTNVVIVATCGNAPNTSVWKRL